MTERLSHSPDKTWPDVIVSFYLEECPDSEGRMIEAIWGWGYDKLEFVHDYIQWLFPLLERSRFNDAAPILNGQTIEAFGSDARLKGRLIISLRLMLGFYGFRLDEGESGEVRITKSHEYPARKSNWISKGNHNYLRLTRIIKSLRLLGLGDHARALFQCLSEIYEEEKERIGQNTFSFWEMAARPL